MNVPMWWGKPDKKTRLFTLKSRARHYRPAREGNYLRILNRLESQAKSIHTEMQILRLPQISLYSMYIYHKNKSWPMETSTSTLSSVQLLQQLPKLLRCVLPGQHRIFKLIVSRDEYCLFYHYFRVIFQSLFLGGCDVWKHYLRLSIWVSRLKTYEIDCSKGWKTWI